MTSLEHRKRVLAFQEQQARQQHERLFPTPSAEAMNAVAEVEEAERDQCRDPDDWMEWSQAYRLHIARKIDACFRGRR